MPKQQETSVCDRKHVRFEIPLVQHQCESAFASLYRAAMLEGVDVAELEAWRAAGEAVTRHKRVRNAVKFALPLAEENCVRCFARLYWAMCEAPHISGSDFDKWRLTGMRFACVMEV